MLVRSLLLRAKLHFGFQKVVSTKTLRKKPLAVHRLACVNIKDKYQEMVVEKLNIIKSNGKVSSGYCWSVMKTSLLAAAEEVVGYGGRVQPDWFQERILTGKECCRMIFYTFYIGKSFVNVSMLLRLL